LILAAQTIRVAPASYKTSHVIVEADWSAISYWYGFTALAEKAEITLPNVSSKSMQGDRVIATIMEKLGVQSTFKNNQLILTKQKADANLVWDFKDCPDLAQTVVPVCAVKGITGTFTGLESLRIKETDRIAALTKRNCESRRYINRTFETGNWILTPGKIPTSEITIDTYHDHRMAMGFAPWATLTDLKINDPSVVNKSYPGFWEDVRTVGILVGSN
jgi:3-phosphoshikimate 1-carboxyvinyltransferase